VFSLALRGPLILTLLDCTDLDLAALPVFDRPDALIDFPEIAHLQLTTSRTVAGGPTLTSGLVAVAPVATTNTVALDLSVAAPVAPILLGGADLSAADGVPLPVGTGMLELRFAVESGNRSDYFDVVLHRVMGGSTVVERIYTITEPTLAIDREVLASGATYVLELRAFRGATDAPIGDFTRYLPAQSSAVVYTRTFVAP
jgi:hypothetical protein